MSYVDAIHDKETDVIRFVERVDGERRFKDIPANYVFYYEDPNGTYKSLWGDRCKKFQSHNGKHFQKELAAMKRAGKKIHESDLNPLFRSISENYAGSEPPKLQIAYFDIETDFDPEKGFADVWDPFSRITAITTYLSHIDKNITLVLKPDLPEDHPDFLSWEAADAICNKFDDTILCNDEEELLTTFVDLVEDSDILTGWNSQGYDIPYTINRINRILDPSVSAKLCLWNKAPKKRKYVKFKKEQATYDLIGRVHLDYLELYQKYSYHELHSYKLDFVGELEVGEHKVPYDGTLDDLYKKDFEKFIEYNRQDVMLLVKIDRKKRFIDLSIQLAHTNGVILQTTMGSVAMIDNAIVNEAHSRGMVVLDKERTFDDDEEGDTAPAAGAYVAVPETGLRDGIGCGDINSLYPSTIRAMNMGPETLVGQIIPTRTDALIENRINDGMGKAEGWHELFCLVEFDLIRDKSDEIIEIEFEDGTKLELSGAEIHELVYSENSTYILSANGTLFRKDVEAVIPGLLSNWYSNRKKMQAKAKTMKALTTGGIDLEGLEV